MRNLLLVVAPGRSRGHAQFCPPPRPRNHATSTPRFFYETIVRKDLLHQLRYKNVHQVPQIEPRRDADGDAMRPGTLDHPVPAAWMLELPTGQRARLTKTRRNNARYKIRQGTLEGAMVKLHGDSMYEFVDRLLTQVLPRVTDFLTGAADELLIKAAGASRSASRPRGGPRDRRAARQPAAAAGAHRARRRHLRADDGEDRRRGEAAPRRRCRSSPF